MKGHVHGTPSKPDSHTMFCGNHVQLMFCSKDFDMWPCMDRHRLQQWICIFEIQVTLGVLLILEEFSCCDTMQMNYYPSGHWPSQVGEENSM